MTEVARMTCAFPESALPVADKLSNLARRHGLAAWLTPSTDGEWQIRFEGERDALLQFSLESGLGTQRMEARQQLRGRGDL